MLASSSTDRSALPAQTRIGAVELGVANLDRAVAYWTNVIGLRVGTRDSGAAELAAGRGTLVRLVEQPGVVPAPHRTGLFHVALLVPERDALGAWALHAVHSGSAIDGASDHTVSEALYLTDPDGHGIELCWDRPRSGWEGRVPELMGTAPLALEGLLATAPQTAFTGLPDGTTIGHVHLRVASISATISYYSEVLGFDLVTTYGSQAAFLAVDGYHHQLGANTWQSEGGRPPAPHEASLRHVEIVLPTTADRDAAAARVRDAGGIPVDHGDGWLVRDPSGIGLLLRTPST